MKRGVVDRFYSLTELSVLLGFGERFFRQQAQQGEFTLREGDAVVSEPVEIGGELRIPAGAVNAWLARNPYRYDAGIKARNTAELRRKLADQSPK